MKKCWTERFLAVRRFQNVFSTELESQWNHASFNGQIQETTTTYDTAAELTLVPPVDTPLPDNDMGGKPVDTFALLVSPGVAQSGSP